MHHPFSSSQWGFLYRQIQIAQNFGDHYNPIGYLHYKMLTSMNQKLAVVYVGK